MKSDRRGFLKSGAALAGGFTLGAVAPGIAQAPGNGQTPGTGQTPKPEKFIKAGKELVEYGERSHFVTSVRMAHPTGGRPRYRSAPSPGYLRRQRRDAVRIWRF